MDIYVFDRDMNLKGIVDTIISLIRTRRYQAAGDIKLIMPCTQAASALMDVGSIVMLPGDDEAAQISYKAITRDQQGLEQIELQGKMLTGWLGKRILLEAATLTGTPGNIIDQLVTDNLTAPSDSNRQIAALSVDAYTGTDTAISYAPEQYSSLLTAVSAIAQDAELGLRILTDATAKTHKFSVYKGLDRTIDQSINPRAVFARTYDNLLSAEYTASAETLCTTAYVGGETGETITQKVVTVGGTQSGLDRVEMYLNAGDIKQNDTENAIALTNAEYEALLAQRGREELAQHVITRSFTSKIDTQGALKYRRDYDVGDIVTCIEPAWGVRINVRIAEMSEAYQQGGLTLEATFGSALPTLFDVVRKFKGR